MPTFAYGYPLQGPLIFIDSFPFRGCIIRSNDMAIGKN